MMQTTAGVSFSHSVIIRHELSKFIVANAPFHQFFYLQGNLLLVLLRNKSLMYVLHVFFLTL